MNHEAIPAIIGVVLIALSLLLGIKAKEYKKKKEGFSHLALIVGIASLVFSALESLDIIDYL